MKTVIFDFDGVLADSFKPLYTLIKKAMLEVGISLTEDQYRSFFNGNVHENFKVFINNPKAYDRFAIFRKLNYLTYYSRVKLFMEANTLIRNLKRQNNLAIASAGNRDAITDLLTKDNLSRFFDVIVATNLQSKFEILDFIVSTTPNHIKAMVTDTSGDIIAAKSLGLKTIAVTWGFQQLDDLQRSNPDYIVDSFQKLEKVLLNP